MLSGDYFYNGTIKKVVAVFGTVFNNIHVGKMIGGKLTNVFRVPLAYGPRQKFIERIQQRDDQEDGAKVAIKVPRMSFEITAITYDSSAKLNPMNTRVYALEANDHSITHHRMREGVPYKIGMQLNILGNTQDDVLQILEQILPSFAPEYTVSVLDMNGPGKSMDVPITLTSTSISDDYEQDVSTGHRIIVYTLDFEIKIKFVGSPSTQGIIKHVEVFFRDGMRVGTPPLDEVDVILGDLENDTPDNYTVVTTFGFTPEDFPDYEDPD
jgi:hypothetical protein